MQLWRVTPACEYHARGLLWCGTLTSRDAQAEIQVRVDTFGSNRLICYNLLQKDSKLGNRWDIETVCQHDLHTRTCWKVLTFQYSHLSQNCVCSFPKYEYVSSVGTGRSCLTSISRCFFYMLLITFKSSPAHLNFRLFISQSAIATFYQLLTGVALGVGLRKRSLKGITAETLLYHCYCILGWFEYYLH